MKTSLRILSIIAVSVMLALIPVDRLGFTTVEHPNANLWIVHSHRIHRHVFASVTKANVVVANNITMTAGAGDVTSSNTSLTGTYHAVCHIIFTNGGTGPTVAPRVDVYAGESTTVASDYKIVTVNGDTTNSSVNDREVVLDDAYENVGFISGSNTGQNVTLRIVVEEITAI